jgi:hypothetical protein
MLRKSGLDYFGQAEACEELRGAEDRLIPQTSTSRRRGTSRRSRASAAHACRVALAATGFATTGFVLYHATVRPPLVLTLVVVMRESDGASPSHPVGTQAAAEARMTPWTSQKRRKR